MLSVVIFLFQITTSEVQKKTQELVLLNIDVKGA